MSKTIKIRPTAIHILITYISATASVVTNQEHSFAVRLFHFYLGSRQLWRWKCRLSPVSSPTKFSAVSFTVTSDFHSCVPLFSFGFGNKYDVTNSRLICCICREKKKVFRSGNGPRNSNFKLVYRPEDLFWFLHWEHMITLIRYILLIIYFRSKVICNLFRKQILIINIDK